MEFEQPPAATPLLPTDKQIETCEQLGIYVETYWTRADASEAISEFIGQTSNDTRHELYIYPEWRDFS